MASFDDFFGMGNFDNYKTLHQLAKTGKPEGAFDGDIYGAAILSHHKQPSSCEPIDFVWFKVKGVSFSPSNTL